MNACVQSRDDPDLSELGRQRLLSRRCEPLFAANWDRALFIHYEVDAAALQQDVPFTLDLFEDRAYISLVAFTMRGMRLKHGGKLGAWLLRWIPAHCFLNVRTYVRHRGEPGIFFLAEWLTNPICVRLGPITYGLPYQFGRLNYRHQHESGRLTGSVEGAEAGGPSLQYECRVDDGFSPCPTGTSDEFLLERYTAYTCRGGTRRLFRIWHEPWLQAQADVTVLEDGLLRGRWEWFAGARRAGAHYSPGASQVWMGRPHRVERAHAARRSVLSAMFELP